MKNPIISDCEYKIEQLIEKYGYEYVEKAFKNKF